MSTAATLAAYRAELIQGGFTTETAEHLATEASRALLTGTIPAGVQLTQRSAHAASKPWGIDHPDDTPNHHHGQARRNEPLVTHAFEGMTRWYR